MTVTNNRKPSISNEPNQVDLEPGLLVECDSCGSNITHSVHIRCAAEECRVTNIDLCPRCFCKGKEVGKHKAWHPYRVIERHSYPIFTENWGADEELLLIDGLLTNGMGSWADAAEHVGTRTREEAERHYNEVYVDSPDWPMPNMNVKFDFDLEEFQARKKRRLEEIQKAPIEHTVSSKPLVSAPTNHEIAGYMPGRLEFETEVENEAEEQVKDLEFGLVMEYGGADQPEGDPPAAIMEAERKAANEEDGDGDGDVKMEDGSDKDKGKKDEEPDVPLGPPPVETPASLELKLCLLAIYNEKINRRLETKAVVFDRGLLEMKKLQAIERKRGGGDKEKEKKAERDFINKHKPFARLQTASDYETFVEGLLYEVSLRKRIQELQEYRRMGITTLAEAEKYEKDKVARAQGIRVVPPIHSEESGGRYRPGGLTLATSSSLQLLTPQEQLLCSQLRILPKPYLAIKEALLREYIKKGGKLRKRDARDLFKIDKDKTGKIYDFLNNTGAFKPVQQAAFAQQQAAAAAIAANLAMMVNGTGPGATPNAGPGNTPANSAPSSQVVTVPPLMAPSAPDVVMHPASLHS